MKKEEQIRAAEEAKIEQLKIIMLSMESNEGFDNILEQELNKYEPFYRKMSFLKAMIDKKPKLYFRKQKEAFSNMKKTYKNELDKRVKSELDKKS